MNDDHWYFDALDASVLGQHVDGEPLRLLPLMRAKISSVGLESNEEPAVITVTGESDE